MVRRRYDEAGRGAHHRPSRRLTPTALRRLVRVLVLGLLLGLASGSGPAGPAAGAPDDPEVVGVWPLVPAPPIVTGFDPPDQPWEAGHRGVDLLGAVGHRVHTALPGRVAFVGRIAGRGVVVVSHGDTRTTYEPVVGSLPVGTRVAAGAVVGHLELAGSHCLPRACLHWGWLRGSTYLNPLLLAGIRPVRLLPLFSDAPSPRAVTPAWAAWRPLAQLVAVRAQPLGHPASG